jgi:hypothetical protein
VGGFRGAVRREARRTERAVKRCEGKGKGEGMAMGGGRGGVDAQRMRSAEISPCCIQSLKTKLEHFVVM